MRLSPVDVLRHAHERLCDPARWLKGTQHEAEGVDGRPCPEGSETAVRWGLYGALVSAKSSDASLDAACTFLARVVEIQMATSPRLCATCGQPATCFGAYEEATTPTFACDECCGHGNEDGWCGPFAEPCACPPPALGDGPASCHRCGNLRSRVFPGHAGARVLPLKADVDMMARLFDWHDNPARAHADMLDVLARALSLAEEEQDGG